MDLSLLRGIFPPMLTPLTPDERVDEASLRDLVDFLLDSGVHGIWAMGTTGEFATLPEEERARAVKATVDQVKGRVPVIANVGDGSTGLALRHAHHAVDAGADALAVTPPYYYQHTMDEMLTHFRGVKQAFPDVPLLVYNIPQNVKVKMAVATVLELAREGTVHGIKDSQNDLQWFRAVSRGAREAGFGDTFRMFLGTRTLIDSGMTVGAHGAIPATSNIAPAACVAAYEGAVAGDFRAAAEAQEMVQRYEDLALVARGGSGEAASFSAMKHTLKSWGIIREATVTRPLRALNAEEQAELQRRLADLPVAGKVLAAA